MPKSKEVLESDDSYDSDEVKPRTKKLKTAAAKRAGPPPTKNGKKKEEDEDEKNEDEVNSSDETETKPG